MDKIFIVTTGEYPDYSLEAAFSTRELAERYIDSRAWSVVAEIEEMPVDSDAGHLRAGMYVYDIEIATATADVLKLELGSDSDERVLFAQANPESADAFNWPTFKYDRLYMSVWAKDEQHAAKIAMERRSKWLADNHNHRPS